MSRERQDTTPADLEPFFAAERPIPACAEPVRQRVLTRAAAAAIDRQGEGPRRPRWRFGLAGIPRWCIAGAAMILSGAALALTLNGVGPFGRRERHDAQPTASPGSAPPADPTLILEVRLLARARADLVAERFDRALAAIQDHARRFPQGRLVEERDALEVRTLARMGRLAQARSLLARFRARFPGSALRAGLEDSLRDGR